MDGIKEYFVLILFGILLVLTISKYIAKIIINKVGRIKIFENPIITYLSMAFLLGITIRLFFNMGLIFWQKYGMVVIETGITLMGIPYQIFSLQEKKKKEKD